MKLISVAAIAACAAIMFGALASYASAAGKPSSASLKMHGGDFDALPPEINSLHARHPRVTGDIPNCPSTEHICKLNTLHIESPFAGYCPGFSSLWAKCAAITSAGPEPWCCWSEGNIFWSHYGGHLLFDYTATDERKINVSLKGFLPGDSSADYTVTNTYVTGNKADWGSPGEPGKRAGEVGGPLYLNFVNGSFGVDVYIHGYLFKKN